MKAIGLNIQSHLALAGVDDRRKVMEVRATDAYPVASFHDLVTATAEIAYRNPKFLLFYRGQTADFRDAKNRTTIMPQLYRKLDGWGRTPEVERRIELLERARLALVKHMKDVSSGRGASRVGNYPEIGWSILQHYDACESPLLDVTQSLRVAASFALPESDSNEFGYVYVLGFPHVSGSMTFSAEEETVNIRLLSICPPSAKQPFFQEGFLVGSFPIARTGSISSQDVGRRLIAKFRISRDSFWDSHYQRIPESALFPPNDPFVSVCGKVRLEVGLPPKASSSE